MAHQLALIYSRFAEIHFWSSSLVTVIDPQLQGYFSFVAFSVEAEQLLGEATASRATGLLYSERRGKMRYREFGDDPPAYSKWNKTCLHIEFRA